MKLITVVFLFLTLFFVFPTKADAALYCEAGNFRSAADGSSVQNFDVPVCIGGFTSRDIASQPMTINVECRFKRSFLFGLPTAPCTGEVQSRTITPSSIGEEDTDGDGIIDNYYTCYNIIDLDRLIAFFDVSIDTVEGQCRTTPLEANPSNFDYWRDVVDRARTGQPPIVRSPLCAGGEINTAIGCIPFQQLTEFTSFILGWGLGVGGGVSLVLIVYAGISMLLSMGDPGRLAQSRSLMTAAISGLLMIIFSTFLLRLIGVDILQLFG